MHDVMLDITKSLLRYFALMRCFVSLFTLEIFYFEMKAKFKKRSK